MPALTSLLLAAPTLRGLQVLVYVIQVLQRS